MGSKTGNSCVLVFIAKDSNLLDNEAKETTCIPLRE